MPTLTSLNWFKMGRWISFTHSQRLFAPIAVPQLCDVWRRPALTLLTWTFGTREKAALFNVRAVRGATDISEGVTKAFFPNGLARLSLTDVHDTACLWFIENCSPAATVHLCNCPSSRENERLGRMLENKSMPSCLIHRLEVVEEPNLLARVCFVTSLEYLTKLSWNFFSENVVRMFVRTSSTSLPRLKYLHVRYRKCPEDDFNNRITWMPGPCSKGSEVLVRSSPCIQSC